METCIFKHCNSTFWECIDCSFLSKCIWKECNFFSKFFCKVFYNWSHAVFSVDEFFCIFICPCFSSFFCFFLSFFNVFFWITQVAHKNKTSWILFQNVFDCRKSSHNTSIVLYYAIFHWYVKIYAHNNALAFKINIFYCLNHLGISYVKKMLYNRKYIKNLWKSKEDWHNPFFCDILIL